MLLLYICVCVRKRKSLCYLVHGLWLCNPTVPSAPPSFLMVTDVNSTTITVQWGPVEPCTDQNGAITGYSVRYGSENVSVSGDSSGGMTTITGLSPSTTYSIQVAAETSAGTGVYSSAVDQLTSGVYYYIIHLHIPIWIPMVCIL